MKTTALTILLTAISLLSYAQTLKVQGGTSYSSLQWKLNNISGEVFNEQLTGYSILIGIDYANNKFFNLSSNMGMLRKGGVEGAEGTIITNVDGTPVDKDDMAKLDYLTMNTTIDLKYGLKQYGSPYLSIGPRFDYLINFSEEFNQFDENNKLNKYNFGLLVGVGYKYEIFDVMFGLRADYYANFMKIAEWDADVNTVGGSIQDQTYTITATIGYKLK